MKIIIYCQHVLGVGHFFRTLELAKAMKAHEVILVTGGGKLDVDLPAHIRQVALPGLMMDAAFNGLHPSDPGRSLDDVKKQRQTQLLTLIQKEKPSVFLIELYPFGRKAFRFELEPVIAYLKNQNEFSCKVVSSIRDILVEKQDQHLHEKRVVQALNQGFDAVIVHSDPRLIRLENTFESIGQIHVPIRYTGFVTPMPDPFKIKGFTQFKKTRETKMVVASAGGGNVGAALLRSVVQAFARLPFKNGACRLLMFTGPYMDEADKNWLRAFKAPGICVEEFCKDFVSLLSVADLSVSMAGYNTCMNILAAEVPALVWPFDQNREQRERVTTLQHFSPMILLETADLDPTILARHIEQQLRQPRQKKKVSLNMDGARSTVNILEAL